ncbi:MAG: DUF3105 domain-containing protein [Anaerolineae bacterium]
MTKASRKVTREMQRQQQKKSSRNAGIWTIGIISVVGLLAVVLVIWLPSRPVAVLDGVQVYNNLPRDHSEAAQTYNPIPPVGGVHSATWLNCGIYDQPVKNENAVHSLEHGAVWITYRPDLPQASIDKLRSLARGHSHVIVSPYPDLTKPIFASAWGLQLPLDDANDARLPVFISRYEQGPQTPEPGAVCDGGIGTPQS